MGIEVIPPPKTDKTRTWRLEKITAHSTTRATDPFDGAPPRAVGRFGLFLDERTLRRQDREEEEWKQPWLAYKFGRGSVDRVVHGRERHATKTFDDGHDQGGRAVDPLSIDRGGRADPRGTCRP